MIYPNIYDYMQDSEQFNLIPVYCEVRADFETPVSIFMKVKAKILLESIEQGENVGRFSIIGLGRRMLMKLEANHLTITTYDNYESICNQEEYTAENPLLHLREYFQQFKIPQYETLPPFFAGAIGFLGYETLHYFEKIPTTTFNTNSDTPDGLMIIPEMVLVYDSVKRTVQIIALTQPGTNPTENYLHATTRIKEICTILAQPLTMPNTTNTPPTTPPTVEYPMVKTDFLKAVETCKEHIHKGDIIQAVLSQPLHIHTTAEPFELYRTLRVLNPSPYLFFLDFENFILIGSSPEVMVRVQNRELLLKPIAGTRKRGQSIATDDALAKELLADPKERAEHLMLVDLGRNDLGRIATPGSVRVSEYMKVEKFSHVMHIVSTIEAQLDPQFDVFDVIRACFPAGTLTGAPKIRAMEIINTLEKRQRGPYGGMIFNLGFNGNLDSCITIRTLHLKNGIATIQAGAGIVADSIPENEYQETLNKAQALIDAITHTSTNGDLT